MKALSIRQPFAWQIVQGIKVIEFRLWRTHYRGPFFVHATQNINSLELARERSWLSKYGITLPDDLPTGVIVGMARLAACFQRVEFGKWRRAIESLFGRRPPPGTVICPDSYWFVEPYGFILEDARPLPFKKYSGQQKFSTCRMTCMVRSSSSN